MTKNKEFQKITIENRLAKLESKGHNISECGIMRKLRRQLLKLS